jgi:RNA recognition motif-containing protein
MKSVGDVLRADVLTSYDGRSKGCGIVEYASAAEAQKAVEELNNTELMGRQIFVREDREANAAGGGEDGQSKRVYVGNLSWEVAWQDLKDHMRTAGDVQYAEVMTDHDGRSKGCGIVEFTTADGAKEAIEKLTDTELKGRMIFVREDREQGGGGGGGYHHGGGGGGGGWHHQGGRGHHGHGGGGLSVYVGNLAYETSWQDLKDHMRAAGNVDKVNNHLIHLDSTPVQDANLTCIMFALSNKADVLKGDDGRSKGCGIVIYQKPAEAARAIRELQNTQLHGRPIFVREDREQGGGHHGGGGGYHRGGGGGGGYQNRHNNSYMQGTPAEEGCQLFVGNLSWETGWRELKDHFRQCGEVDRAEVAEGSDGRKRGFGLVRFHSAKDAQKAISQLNGVEFMGRALDVRIDNKA